MTTRRTFLGAAAALAGLPEQDDSADESATAELPDPDDYPSPERIETGTYTDYGYAEMDVEADVAELSAAAYREPDGKGGHFENVSIMIDAQGMRFGISVEFDDARAFAQEILDVTQEEAPDR